MTFRPLRWLLLAACLLVGAGTGLAQDLSSIRLGVDASEVARKIIHC